MLFFVSASSICTSFVTPLVCFLESDQLLDLGRPCASLCLLQKEHDAEFLVLCSTYVELSSS